MVDVDKGLLRKSLAGGRDFSYERKGAQWIIESVQFWKSSVVWTVDWLNVKCLPREA
jgi:hypothetical protein